MSIHLETLRDIATNGGFPVCDEVADELESCEQAYALLFKNEASLRRERDALLSAYDAVVRERDGLRDERDRFARMYESERQLADALQRQVTQLLAERDGLEHQLGALMTERDGLREALAEAQGCFTAADVEGWSIAILGNNMDLVRDIWNRRLSFALQAIDAALQGPPHG